MEIVEYTARTLRDALEDDSFWEANHLPITKHRALSQIHNPRADEDDVLLIVAYDEDGAVMAYIGIVPDWIYLKGEREKFGWLSCWWSDPEKRGSGAGMAVFHTAWKAYDDRLGGTSFSESAQRVYERFEKTVEFKRLPRFTFMVRPCLASVLPERMGWTVHIRPLLRLADKIAKPILAAQLGMWKKRIPNRSPHYTSERLERMDDATYAFIDRVRDKDFTRRGIDEFNWIREYPWVLETASPTEEDRRYFFSATARIFAIDYIRIRDDDGAIIAFLALQRRDAIVDVQYVYCERKAHAAVAHRISLYMATCDACLLMIYQPWLRQEIYKNGFPWMYMKKGHKPSIISTRYDKRRLEEVSLQAGDGDSLFT